MTTPQRAQEAIYLTLHAGLKLDTLIAEEVMGVRWADDRCRICGWPFAESREEGCVDGDCSMRPPPERRADETARYSTDLARAWTVVEKLGTRFHAVIRTPFDPFRPCGGGYLYSCGFTPHGVTGWNGRHDFEAMGETLPLAICRAALRAKGSP